MEAPLDGTKLLEQADHVYSLLSDAAKVSKTTPAIWHSIDSSVDLKNRVSEWCTLASIAMVQIGLLIVLR